MDGFQDVMSTTDLPDGSMTAVEIGGEKVLVAHVGDTFYATQEHCPHMHANLAKGTLEGTIVTCPLHHSQFDLTDGHVVRWTDWTGVVESVGEALRHPRPLRVYEVAVEGDRVSIGPAHEA